MDLGASVFCDGHSPIFHPGSVLFALAVVYRVRCVARYNSSSHASYSVAGPKKCGTGVWATKVRQQSILRGDLRGQLFSVVFFGIWVHQILVHRGLRACAALEFRRQFPSRIQSRAFIPSFLVSFIPGVSRGVVVFSSQYSANALVPRFNEFTNSGPFVFV